VQVAPIVDDVKERGDAAVKDFTSKFDKVDMTTVCVPIDVRTPHCDLLFFFT